MLRPPPAHVEVTPTIGFMVGDGESSGVTLRVGVDVRVWCGDGCTDGDADVAMRMRFCPSVVKRTAPDAGETTTSVGLEKEAKVPTPSVFPQPPLPPR